MNIIYNEQKSKVFVIRRILRMKYSSMVVKTSKRKLFYKFSNEIIQPLKVRRTIPLFNARMFSYVILFECNVFCDVVFLLLVVVILVEVKMITLF